MSAKAHKGGSHHEAAAEHHETAAHHHREAAKHYEAGDHEKAGHHAHVAHAHELHATHHGHEAAKHHASTTSKLERAGSARPPRDTGGPQAHQSARFCASAAVARGLDRPLAAAAG
jgi:hypothetical protein